MKRFLITLLIALLALGVAATAEEEGFGFDFAEEGYEGEWILIDDLDIEFCLPEGWTPLEVDEDEAFTAMSEDGRASLRVRLEQEGVEDLTIWGESRLDSYRTGEANLHDVLIVETEESLIVRFIADEDRLIAFEFAREAPEALELDFALQIVGSAYEGWADEGFDFGDIDVDWEGFDFMEAFGGEDD